MKVSKAAKWWICVGGVLLFGAVAWANPPDDEERERNKIESILKYVSDKYNKGSKKTILASELFTTGVANPVVLVVNADLIRAMVKSLVNVYSLDNAQAKLEGIPQQNVMDATGRSLLLGFMVRLFDLAEQLESEPAASWFRGLVEQRLENKTGVSGMAAAVTFATEKSNLVGVFRQPLMLAAEEGLISKSVRDAGAQESQLYLSMVYSAIGQLLESNEEEAKGLGRAEALRLFSERISPFKDKMSQSLARRPPRMLLRDLTANKAHDDVGLRLTALEFARLFSSSEASLAVLAETTGQQVEHVYDEVIQFWADYVIEERRLGGLIRSTMEAIGKIKDGKQVGDKQSSAEMDVTVGFRISPRHQWIVRGLQCLRWLATGGLVTDKPANEQELLRIQKEAKNELNELARKVHRVIHDRSRPEKVRAAFMGFAVEFMHPAVGKNGIALLNTLYGIVRNRSGHSSPELQYQASLALNSFVRSGQFVEYVDGVDRLTSIVSRQRVYLLASGLMLHEGSDLGLALTRSMVDGHILEYLRERLAQPSQSDEYERKDRIALDSMTKPLLAEQIAHLSSHAKDGLTEVEGGREALGIAEKMAFQSRDNFLTVFYGSADRAIQMSPSWQLFQDAMLIQVGPSPTDVKAMESTVNETDIETMLLELRIIAEERDNRHSNLLREEIEAEAYDKAALAIVNNLFVATMVPSKRWLLSRVVHQLEHIQPGLLHDWLARFERSDSLSTSPEIQHHATQMEMWLAEVTGKSEGHETPRIKINLAPDVTLSAIERSGSINANVIRIRSAARFAIKQRVGTPVLKSVKR